MKPDATNPYVGLRPFEVDESLLFFGRNDQTLELLNRLHRHHFVAVVGGSGCGKSSLLRAGLIPALKAGYLVEDSDHWFITIMKPGHSPLYNLAESILQQIHPEVKAAAVSDLLQKIKEEGAGTLLNILIPLCKKRSSNFFLLVDQFEELFRFAMEQNDVGKKDEAVDFVNIILELSQQKELPFYVVITMRSDFIGDCAQFYGLPEAMNQSQYLVPRLNRVQLKTVIEGPAKLYGGKLNPSLTSRLLNETGKVRDELPLLQHALMRIWDFEATINKNGQLDLQDYISIGGIEKALSNHADEALAGMNSQESLLTKEIFQALTAIDENGRKIRRPVLLSQLEELTGANSGQLLRIINLFIKDKRSFLVINKAGDSSDKVIDISHESLIRQWNTLSKWVDKEAESAAVYLRLAESAELYKQKKKDFLTGSELQIALAWYNKFNPVSAWANRYRAGFEETIEYLVESEKEWDSKQKQEEEKQKQEEARTEQEAARQKEEKAIKQKQRYLMIGVIVLLIFAVGAGLATYSFFKQNEKINEALAIANHHKLLGDSIRMVAEHEKEKAIHALANLQTTAKSLDAAIAGFSGEDKKKLEAVQQNLKDNVLDLIGQPVFNLQQYAKENSGILMDKPGSKNEPRESIEFSGAKSAIKVPNLPDPLVKSKTFSVVAIVKPGPGGNGSIVNALEGFNGFYFFLKDHKPRVDIFYGKESHAFCLSQDLLIKREWNLLLFTFKKNEIKIRVNNGSWTSAATYGHDISFSENSKDFIIGGKALYGSSNFTGFIENILFYDHLLTPDEENNLYQFYKHLIR